MDLDLTWTLAVAGLDTSYKSDWYCDVNFVMLYNCLFHPSLREAYYQTRTESGTGYSSARHSGSDPQCLRWMVDTTDKAYDFFRQCVLQPAYNRNTFFFLPHDQHGSLGRRARHKLHPLSYVSCNQFLSFLCHVILCHRSTC